MFNVGQYQTMYNKFLGPLSQSIGLLLNNGTDFDAPIMVNAHVSSYKEKDLVSGGPIILGDLKLIILFDDLPVDMRRLGKQDRINIDGRNYGIVHWDTNHRSIGETTIAVEATVRG